MTSKTQPRGAQGSACAQTQVSGPSASNSHVWHSLLCLLMGRQLLLKHSYMGRADRQEVEKQPSCAVGHLKHRAYVQAGVSK